MTTIRPGKYWLLLTFVGLLAGCGATHDPDASMNEQTRARVAEVFKQANEPASRTALQDPLAGARTLVAAGRVDEGLAQARSIVAASNGDLTLGLQTGRLAVTSARPLAAADIYRELLVRRPDSVEALNGLGVALAQQGDLAGASQALRQALALRPDDQAAKHNLDLVTALGGTQGGALPTSLAADGKAKP